MKIGFILLNTSVIDTHSCAGADSQLLRVAHRQVAATFCSCSCSCFLAWTQKYLVHGLQSECCQKWENMCVKLLKMFLAAYPVSKRSYFSWQGRRGGFPVSASLIGTNIFEIHFLNPCRQHHLHIVIVVPSAVYSYLPLAFQVKVKWNSFGDYNGICRFQKLQHFYTA